MPATQPQPTDNIAQAISAAIAAAMAQNATQAPQLDEQQIIDLINKHATKTVEIKRHDAPETKKLTGTHNKFEQVLKYLQIAPVTKVWPYLRGPAGSGKTTLAAQTAEALDIDFYDTASINDKFELIGFVNPNGDYQQTPFYRAMKNGGVFLFDEIDGSAPEAVLAFNMALSNGVYTFPNGERVSQHKDCYFIAGGNTFGKGATAEYSARELLDGATRNRFIEVVIDYDEKLELNLAYAAAEAIDKDLNKQVVKLLHTNIVKARDYAKKQKLDVIVSPRQSIQGAAMLAQGFSANETIQALLASDFTKAQLAEMGV